MLRNYLTVAIRNLLRYKVYSFINILGLTIGLVCCVLMFLYIQDELDYNSTHENADRIYRVLRETRLMSGSPSVTIGTSGALAPALMRDFPEVEQSVRLWHHSGTWVRFKDKVSMQKFCLASENILNVFTFPLLKGDPNIALREPFSILITEEMAQVYFGDSNPLGKMITVESPVFGGDYKITGVLKDVPRNSTLQFDFLTSTARANLRRWSQDDWRRTSTWRPVETYVLLRKGSSLDQLKPKLPDFMERYMGPEVRANNTYHFQPFTRIHLYSKTDYGIPSRGEITNVYVYTAIASFILLIACVNYMNLATARSVNRAQEVGLRKVVGASRIQLIRQFLGESIFLSFLSMVLAAGLVELILPLFNSFVGKNLTLYRENDLYALWGLFSIALFVGILAGGYPAIFLSRFSPVEMLKGTLRTGSKGAWFRKGLIVLQFSTSITLIAVTGITYHQLEYLSAKDLGFNKDQIVVMSFFWADRASNKSDDELLLNRYNAVKQEFLKHPNILKASASASVVGLGGGYDPVHPEGFQANEWKMHVFKADEDFLNTYEIELVEGRNFSIDIASDTTEAFILNETAVKLLGWTNPIGKEFEWVKGNRRGRVVGIVKDFHDRSLREEIGPVVICMWIPKWNALSLRIRGTDIPATMEFLKKKWKEFIPYRPFDYRFLDDSLNQLYSLEIRFGQICGISSLLAIFIACLGVFGLASYTAEQQKKEIGIRKVLGASISDIMMLFSKVFAVLLLIANLIAWPIAYYTVDRWLQNFAYRIEFGIWPFVLSGLLASIVALASVGYQAIKAATADPVDTLRYE